jgi:hypothetical protein
MSPFGTNLGLPMATKDSLIVHEALYKGVYLLVQAALLVGPHPKYCMYPYETDNPIHD